MRKNWKEKKNICTDSSSNEDSVGPSGCMSAPSPEKSYTPSWTQVSFTWSGAEALHPLPGNTGVVFPFRVRNSSVSALLTLGYLLQPLFLPLQLMQGVFLQTLKAMAHGSGEHPRLQERLRQLFGYVWTVMGLNWGSAIQLLRAVLALSYLKGVEAHHRDT